MNFPESGNLDGFQCDKTIIVEGVSRQVRDTRGRLMSSTYEGQSAFWEFYRDGPVDNVGRPIVMYHGTPNDIEAFKPGRHGMMFVSPCAKFASSYAGAEWTIEVEGGSPNVLPVYASVQNPFDFRNELHVRSLLKIVNMTDLLRKYHERVEPDADMEMLTTSIRTGDWFVIEQPEVISCIRSLGHDGIYIEEEGRINLTVFYPEQIKSAIGNPGTYCISEASITDCHGPRLGSKVSYSGAVNEDDPEVVVARKVPRP